MIKHSLYSINWFFYADHADKPQIVINLRAPNVATSKWIGYSRSIWAAEGGEGACNLRAIEIQIQMWNWAWLSVYVYGNSLFQ